MKNLCLLLGVFFVLQINAQQTITFKATDGIEITADTYFSHSEDSPLILLFHQAGWSRGEYKEIAPKLNQLGYNCIAFDQRSGGEVNGVVNQTHKRAEEQQKGTNYADALVDISSAIDYAKSNFKDAKQLIIWGSSYSSALVLKLAGDRGDVDAVLAFSPGEYFKKFGKPKDWIQQSAQHISVPVFITSMKLEKKMWWQIAEAIPSDHLAYFLPKSVGKHGSRALWSKFDSSEAYWEKVKEFLETIK